MKPFVLFRTALVLLSTLCVSLTAQTIGSGTISGTISDPSGGVVADLPGQRYRRLSLWRYGGRVQVGR